MPSLAKPSLCASAGVPRATLACLVVLGLGSGCDQTLEVGHNTTRGKFPIPVGAHAPAILLNDRVDDNWSPEMAALFANKGGSPLVGIVVNATHYWPNLDDNLAGWKAFVSNARMAGLQGIPEPVRSAATPFVVPADRRIESTIPNRSDGAQFIVNKSRELSQPWQPVVVFSGSQMTDLADAYLSDPSVVDRVVVVALLGSYSAPRGLMTGPNGDLDPWADWIVAQKFRYVQVSVYYDQSGDVTENDLSLLPTNAFGTWMAAKRTKLSPYLSAADQEAILALSAPEFIGAIAQSVPDTAAGFGSAFGQGPPLIPNAEGNAWLVTQINTAAARSRLWKMLNDPTTFKR